MPDGTPYDKDTFDGEGLAVLPNGDYLVGRELSSLEVPQRFHVAPAAGCTERAGYLI
ncbi:hypothetical protein [Streptomyces dysideae]|uniref:hypothetical protein n=1 Tax=Streptomyces dysideae TaxID=909626 RepID=UPI00131B0310|nr:hypothetical protein [Streptomyces dysideae]